MTPHRQHKGTECVYQLLYTLHVYKPHGTTSSISVSHPFSIRHAHDQSPHIKSHYSAQFPCLKCRFFATEQVFYMYNMHLSTLRRRIVCISASIKSSQEPTADTFAIKIATPVLTVFFFFVKFPFSCWLFPRDTSPCVHSVFCVYCYSNGEKHAFCILIIIMTCLTLLWA